MHILISFCSTESFLHGQHLTAIESFLESVTMFDPQLGGSTNNPKRIGLRSALSCRQ
jgi:hypothetical protein